ncbi:acyltransferase domain-containing protein [Actinoplanes sp. NPDC048967]|uniref:acyltransferase domain-containing protein n=1 Tax=Actinoplanes sp. NPDC048967 TaxID=3155269 RepID=UPI0033C354A8
MQRLAGDRPPAPLPARPARRACSSGWRCGRTTPRRSWPAGPTRTPRCGRRSCAGCSTALVRADLGGFDWLPPGPVLPRHRGPAWRHLYAYAYLALADVVSAYHRERGIADAVSWATLADLGRNLAVDRRMRGEGWPVMRSWLTLHARGGRYELGRLQHQRGDTAIGLHIPEWAR